MDEKTLKVLAAELAKGLKTGADLNQFSRMLTKLTVETALNAELGNGCRCSCSGVCSASCFGAAKTWKRREGDAANLLI